MTQLIWSDFRDLRLRMISPEHKNQSPIRPLRMRICLAPNVLSFLTISLPYDVVPLFWEWAKEERKYQLFHPSFPNGEAQEKLNSLAARTGGVAKLSWSLVHMRKPDSVRLIWAKPETAEPHILGYIPFPDVHSIAQSAFHAYCMMEGVQHVR
jgi:hypothetical protein